jgi:hypothetical protein
MVNLVSFLELEEKESLTQSLSKGFKEETFFEKDFFLFSPNSPNTPLESCLRINPPCSSLIESLSVANKYYFEIYACKRILRIPKHPNLSNFPQKFTSKLLATIPLHTTHRSSLPVGKQSERENEKNIGFHWP